MTRELTREDKLRIIRTRGKNTAELLSILLDLQEESGMQYVDEESAALVAEELGLSLTKVYDVLTFYSMLDAHPVARHVIEVCGSAPCYFNKSKTVVELLEKILGIKMGETSPDGMFALRVTSCVGACDQGPVMKIGETVYGHLNEARIREVLDGLRGA